MIHILEAKAENPYEPPTYLNKIQDFIDIASKSAGACYQEHSSNTNFQINIFTNSVIRQALIKEIQEAFTIPEHLKGFAVFNPEALPQTPSDLDDYNNYLIAILASFYRAPSPRKQLTFSTIASNVSLK